MRTHASLLTSVVLWAAAFPAIRAGLRGYDFGHLVLLRFLTASIVALGVWLVRGRPLPRRADLAVIVAVGLLSMTIYPAALSFGEQSVPAGTASILVNLSPIFTAILASFFLGERLSAVGWVGIGVAFAGAVMISGGGARFELTAGVLAVLFSALVQGAYFVAAKPLLRRYDGMALTILLLWFGTAADLVFARGFVRAVARAPLEATLAVVFLGVFSSVVGFMTWFYGLARLSAPHAVAFLYLVPPVSIFIAWIWLGERPTAITILGGMVATIGVAIVKSGDAIAAALTPARSSPASPPRG